MLVWMSFIWLVLFPPGVDRPPEPVLVGDPIALPSLEAPLAAALASTAAFGAWPPGAWRLHLHDETGTFEQATGAPPQRAAAWVGATLHLRPWDQLRRRDLGAVLRHELVHRRLLSAGLRRWEEEARCLWAEGHVQPPAHWPPTPPAGVQERLDRALARGTTAEQAWAYRALRAWLKGSPLPAPPAVPPVTREHEWVPAEVPAEERMLTVVWPAERLPARIQVEGQFLSRQRHRFSGSVRFGEGLPIRGLEGEVDLVPQPRGWEVRWTLPRSRWIAAATAGEMGEDSPFEARRALAAVLDRWLAGHPHGRHPDGSFCPLTHCAVVRGIPGPDTVRAAATAPTLSLDPARARFTGSAGGASMSLREVWGRGSGQRGQVLDVPEDRWRRWERVLTPAQVAHLKRTVRPGLRPGQRGLHLGASGPYPVEDLRLAAGRAFGWTLWPSNACAGEVGPDGSLHLRGQGWGHNVGLCMATAQARAHQGWTAEAILAEAFGPEILVPPGGRAALSPGVR